MLLRRIELVDSKARMRVLRNRFRHDQHPLHEAEGALLLCGFVMPLALHQQGRHAEAVG